MKLKKLTDLLYIYMDRVYPNNVATCPILLRHEPSRDYVISKNILYLKMRRVWNFVFIYPDKYGDFGISDLVFSFRNTGDQKLRRTLAFTYQFTNLK